jgi:ribosomal protein L19E
MIDVERTKLNELRKAGKIDNTVHRRLMRVLDLETLEMQMLMSVGHSGLEED